MQAWGILELTFMHACNHARLGHSRAWREIIWEARGRTGVHAVVVSDHRDHQGRGCTAVVGRVRVFRLLPPSAWPPWRVAAGQHLDMTGDTC